MVEATSNADAVLLDYAPAEEAVRYLMDHREVLREHPRLFDSLNALIRSNGLYILIRDAHGQPVRAEPSFPLLQIMAQLGREHP